MTTLYTYSDFTAWFKNFKKHILLGTPSTFSERNKKELVNTVFDALIEYKDVTSNNPLAVIHNIVNEGLFLAKEYDDGFVILPEIENLVKELALSEWKKYEEIITAEPTEPAEVIQQAKAELLADSATVLQYEDEVPAPVIVPPETIELRPEGYSKK